MLFLIPIVLVGFLLHGSRQRRSLALQRKQLAFAEASLVASLSPPVAAEYLRRKTVRKLARGIIAVVLGLLIVWFINQ